MKNEEGCFCPECNSELVPYGSGLGCPNCGWADHVIGEEDECEDEEYEDDEEYDEGEREDDED